MLDYVVGTILSEKLEKMVEKVEGFGFVLCDNEGSTIVPHDTTTPSMFDVLPSGEAIQVASELIEIAKQKGEFYYT